MQYLSRHKNRCEISGDDEARSSTERECPCCGELYGARDGHTCEEFPMKNGAVATKLGLGLRSTSWGDKPYRAFCAELREKMPEWLERFEVVWNTESEDWLFPWPVVQEFQAIARRHYSHVAEEMEALYLSTSGLLWNGKHWSDVVAPWWELTLDVREWENPED